MSLAPWSCCPQVSCHPHFHAHLRLRLLPSTFWKFLFNFSMLFTFLYPALSLTHSQSTVLSFFIGRSEHPSSGLCSALILDEALQRARLHAVMGSTVVVFFVFFLASQSPPDVVSRGRCRGGTRVAAPLVLSLNSRSEDGY